ncbi:hypothetical protein KCV87_32905 [Actinosynnema pretiosum subsp. pretiosum]|uniref:Condensation domain-containing protein n=1 Tax=Actinosynnema pretiosum subsp. pretiosum TaxID=103721 RepID=A0AA45L5S5_9PSEU|nr:pyoverdine chromophore precursor synthetase [Actinosynnema pretiosum subsp. pretiosum]QUF04089.1 hypothetical protein KCV87_32905 [Actinosynnema pretiosum subsp. pretiosum]
MSAGELTATQHQLWALSQGTTSPAALTLAYALRVEGLLDVDALAGAFRAFVLSHEPLRTSFRERDGVVVAEVADDDRALAGLDLVPKEVDEIEVAAAIRREREWRFDLREETPLRVSLLRIAPDRHVLLVTLHHIAGDGWSLYLLNRDVSAHYTTLADGGRVEPVRRGFECSDQARSQRAWLAGPDAEGEARWWVDRLRGAAVEASLPGRSRRDAGAVLRRQTAAIPDALVARLRELAKQAGVSLYATLLAAFEVLIERWTGCERAVIGTLAANRPTAASCEVMGAHYNPLLLDTDVTGDPSLLECLLRTSARTLSALDHQALPFAAVRRALVDAFGDEWDVAPRAMFLMDRYPLAGLELAGCRLTGLHAGDGAGAVAAVPAATDADVTFFVREVGDRLTLSVLYRDDTGLDDASIAAVSHAYLEILAALCDRPETPVGELDPFEAGPGAPTAAHEEPGLHEVTRLAPVDALSPVGDWMGSAQWREVMA